MITKQRTDNFVGQSCEAHSAEADKQELIVAIREAEESIDRGEFITLEEMEKKFYSWTFK